MTPELLPPPGLVVLFLVTCYLWYRFVNWFVDRTFEPAFLWVIRKRYGREFAEEVKRHLEKEEEKP